MGSSASGLLERDAELAALAEVLARARRGAGALVVVEGAPGIGKSRLLAVARERAQAGGLRVLWARGAVLERDYPFGVARRLLAAAVGGGGPPADRRRLRVAAGPAADLLGATSGQAPARLSAEAGFAVLEGLYAVVATLAERRPLLVAVDDAHWADAQSLRFLAYLAGRLEALPVALLVAARPRELGAERELLAVLATDPHAQVLRPAALTEEAVGALVAARTGAEPSAVFARACHTATAGNPFLLDELIRTLAAEGIEPRGEQAPEVLALAPEAVGRAVLARLGRLPPPAAQVAAAVAVLGGSASLRDVAEVAQLDERKVAEATDLLADADVLAHTRPLEFVHPLTRLAVYRDLSPSERERGHLRAAHVLAAAPWPDRDRVAAHLLATDPRGDAWVVEQLAAAASAAMSKGAPESAVRYLRRALEEPPATAVRAQTQLALAQAEAASGDPRAVERLSAGLELVDDRGARARAALELAGLLFARLDLSSAAQVAERGQAEADGDESLAGALAAIRLAAGALLPSREAAVERVQALRREALAGRPPRVPELLCLVAITMSCAGDPPRIVRQLVERALAGEPAAPPVAELLRALFLPQALILLDELDGADRVVDSALARSEGEGRVLVTAFARQWRALILLRKGMLHAAAAEAERALTVRAHGWEAATDHSAGVLAQARLELGDRDGAEAAIALGEAAGAHVTQPMLLYARGRLALAAGDLAAAVQHFETAGRYLEEAFAIKTPALLPWRSASALALHRLGEHERAIALAEHDVAAARRLALAGPLGVALTAAGTIAEDPDILREATGVLERCGARLEHAYALLALGGVLRRSGQASAARQPLQAAVRRARACGAAPLAADAHRELTATGAHPRKILHAGAEALTPSERRVAELAAAGMSNRQIADRLVLSPRTVETHLARAYEKLGITSRHQLTAALLREL